MCDASQPAEIDIVFGITALISNNHGHISGDNFPISPLNKYQITSLLTFCSGDIAVNFAKIE